MKKININLTSIQHLNDQPQILVFGQNQSMKMKLINQLLSQQDFYSQKYGRILYLGQRKYKSDKIIQDNQNWMQTATYDDIISKLSQAKQQKIVNLLFVINTKNVQQYKQIILALLSIRNIYLDGMISLLVNITSMQSLPKQSCNIFNTIFFFQQDQKVNKMTGLNQYQQKRKKDCYIWSKNKVSVFKEIKD